MDPIRNFCRGYSHQTCVVDDKLYIDGGRMFFHEDGVDGWSNETLMEQNTALLYEDLSDPQGNKGFSPQFANLSKDSSVPSVRGGVLWPDKDNKYFYLFGGVYDSVQAAQNHSLHGIDMWRYDTLFDKWAKATRDDSQNSVNWPAFGADTVHKDGFGYYYGGYLTKKSTPAWGDDWFMLNSLMRYDMNTYQWTNSTRAGDSTARAEGTLQYIPASQKGMLIYFGGVEQSQYSDEVSYSNMSQIQVFDVATNRWYTQTATGAIPQSRRGFCAVTVWAQDQSSYNIHVYGGISVAEAGLSDMHVLTFPSFQWIPIEPNPMRQEFKNGGAWMSCDVIYGSQLLIIGGYFVNTSNPQCDDVAVNGQHETWLGQEAVEDANAGKPTWWHEPRSNVTRYCVPDNLVTLIGGDADGGATATEPARGWGTNTDLAVYMLSKYSAPSRTATRSIPTTSSTPAPSSKSDFNGPNVGAIAGGTVGGIIALLGTITFIILCLHRRKSRAEIEQLTNRAAILDQSAPGINRHSVMSAAVSQGITLHSPYQQSPPWSAPGSPPSHQDHISGAWGPQGQYEVQNTYHSPLADIMVQKSHDAYEQPRAEMPDTSPATAIAEMPGE